jgi:hypothetical protein
MASNDVRKFGLNVKVRTTGTFFQNDTEEAKKIRLVVEQSGGSNVIEVLCRLRNAADWVSIGTLTGAGQDVFDVSTYTEIKIDCTTLDSDNDEGSIVVIGSGFGDVVGTN